MEFPKELELNEVNISEIIQLFDKYNIDEMNLEENGLTIEIKTELKQEVQFVQSPVATETILTPQNHNQNTQSKNSTQEEDETSQEDSTYEEIISPMVGTFYEAASPGSPPFVTKGDNVSPSTTVCIVEAMKMMNEIKPEKSGRIVKVCVKNGDPVQPGQALFLIEPS